MCYWIISYMCCPCFYFLSKSLIFTPNCGHSEPKSSFSTPKGLRFTLNFSSGYVSVSDVPSGRCGEGLCCMREAHNMNLLGGLDSNG